MMEDISKLHGAHIANSAALARKAATLCTLCHFSAYDKWFVYDKGRFIDTYKTASEVYANHEGSEHIGLEPNLKILSDELIDGLPVYGGGEDIITCPECGARTGFDDIDDVRQHHICLGCSYEFIVNFDNDEEG